MTWIDDVDTLRDHYRPPHDLVLRKAVGAIDDGAADFLAATTFVVLATAGPDGADASPRGGPPGFVRVLDAGHVAFADLAGNNRLDTYTNVTQDPHVGLLCVIPGVEETLRLNGTARLTTEPDVLEATAIDGRRPKVALVIAVAECYIHCAKALRRAGLWDPSSWPAPADRPSPAEIIKGHLELEVDAQVIADDLEAGYRVTMWEPGGD